MKFWLLDFDVNNYENLEFRGSFDLDFVHSFNGNHKKDDWVPKDVVRIYGRELGDAPGLASHIPVFSERAVKVLAPLLDNYAEVLPLTCGKDIFYAINVTNIKDCVDYKKSDFITFPDGKRIMLFKKYVFDLEKMTEGDEIFKLKDEVLKRPIVSERFRETVIKNNLQGFKFELAWDSENEIV